MVVADLVATISVDTQKLQAGLAQAKAAFLEMGGAATTNSQALRQVAAFDREVEQETARLTALLAGESKAAADVAARFTSIEAPIQAHLVALKAQVAEQLKLQETTAKTSVSLRQLGTDVSGAGRLLTGALTTPLVGLGAAALKAGSDIQQAMVGIQRQTGATGQQLAMFGKELRGIAGDTPSSFHDIGAALAGVSQRTGETGQALESLTRQELLLARLTGTDIAAAVTKTTQVFNQWGVTARNQSKTLDEFYRVSQLTGISIDALTSGLTRHGAVLRTFGFDLAQAAVLEGNLNKEGAVGEKMFMALRQALGTLAKAGIKDADTALEVIIKRIKDAKTPMDAMQFAMSLVGKRGAVDLIAGVKEGVFNIDQLTQKVRESTGALQKAGQDTETYTQAFARLKNQVELALEPLGNVLLKDLQALPGELKPAVAAVREFGDWFGHLSTAQQNTAIGMGLFAAGVGPFLFGLGQVITGVQRTTAAFAAVQAAISEVGLVSATMPLVMGGAFLAVGALALGLATNFGGMRTEFVSDWEAMIEASHLATRELGSDMAVIGGVISGTFHTAVSDAEFFFTHLKQVSQLTVADIVANRAKAAAAMSGTAETVGRRPITAAGLMASGFAQHLGTPARFAGPPLTAAMKEQITAQEQENAALEKQKQNWAQVEAAINRATAAKVKKTPADLKELELANEIVAKQQELNVLRAGEGNILGQVVARFGSLNPAEERHLANILQQIKATEAHTKAQDAFHKKLAEVEAQIRALETGHPVKEAEQSLGPGVSAAQRQRLMAETARLDQLQQQRNQEKTLSDAIAGATDRYTASLAKLHGATTQEVTAEQLFAKALASGNPLLIDRATSLVALSAQYAQEQANNKAALAAFSQEEAAVKALGAVQDQQQQVAAELAGSGKQLTEVQKALNLAYESGDQFLIAWAEDLAKAGQAQDQQIALNKQYTDTFDKIIAAGKEWQQKLTDLQQGERGAGLAQQLWNAALDTGDPLLIQMAADVGDTIKQVDDLTAAQKLARAEQERFQKGLEKASNFIQGEFTKAFEGLRKGGLKDIFQNMLADLDQFLFDWAAKLAAAQLTQGLFNAAGLGGQMGGGTGPLSGLAALFGGLFGAGGLAAGDVAAPLVSAVPLGPAIPAGFQQGGAVFGGTPVLVGETGPEVYVPASSGTVYPTGSPQTQTAMRRGGGNITQNFHITTPNPQAFQRSQSQIAQDASRAIERHRQRSGF